MLLVDFSISFNFSISIAQTIFLAATVVFSPKQGWLFFLVTLPSILGLQWPLLAPAIQVLLHAWVELKQQVLVQQEHCKPWGRKAFCMFLEHLFCLSFSIYIWRLDPPYWVVINTKQSYVCWHPPPPHPYCLVEPTWCHLSSLPSGPAVCLFGFCLLKLGILIL